MKNAQTNKVQHPLLRVELCPTKRYVEVRSLVPVNRTFFGNAKGSFQIQAS